MYQGWFVVAAAFITQMFQAGFFVYSFSLFVLPLQQWFDVGRTEVMLSMTGASFVGMFLSPLAGKFVDRYPARLAMSIGCIVLAGGLLLMARAPTIVVFAMLFAVATGVAAQFMGSLVSSAVVTRWFSRARGKALGISAVGTSVGGILIPPIIAMQIEARGWQVTVEQLAYAILLIALPAVLILVKEPVNEPDAAVGHSKDLTEWTLGRILGERAFWCIGLGISLLFAVWTPLLSNISPYAQQIGMSTSDAAQLVMIISTCGLIGKIIFGAAADRISLRVGMWSAQGLVAFGLLLMLLLPEPGMLRIACGVIGLAAGGMLPVWGMMVGEAFGVAAFGRAMGTMSPLITLLVMPTFPVVGFLVDSTGSYTLIFALFIGMCALGALALLPLDLNRGTNKA